MPKYSNLNDLEWGLGSSEDFIVYQGLGISSLEQHEHM